MCRRFLFGRFSGIFVRNELKLVDFYFFRKSEVTGVRLRFRRPLPVSAFVVLRFSAAIFSGLGMILYSCLSVVFTWFKKCLSSINV